MKVSPAVSAVGRRGRQHRGVCRRLAGGGVRGKIPHPSPVIVVVLCSDDDASHRPPPLLSRPRPPPTSCARTLLPPLSLCRPMPALVAARAMTLSSPSSSSPSSRHRNLLLTTTRQECPSLQRTPPRRFCCWHEGCRFQQEVVVDAVPPPSLCIAIRPLPTTC